MRPFLLFLVFLFLICLFPGKVASGSDFLFKREQLEQSLENGDIDRYEVPFATYVSLGMWKEIDGILEANNRNVVKYAFPEGHYSRPVSVNGEIWVFSEADLGKERDGIYVFDADSLKLEKILRSERISRYRGGVRSVFGDRILLSGTGRNMGAAAVWNIQSDSWRTVSLPEGNLVSGAAIGDSFLFIGACGGTVNQWRVNSDIEFIKTYRVDRSKWAAAKSAPEECIQGIANLDDQVIGVGDAHFFRWNLRSAALETVQAKSIKNSAVYIKDPYLVEFHGLRFFVRDIRFNPNVTKKHTVGLPILDVGITRDRVLAEQTGDILVIALAHHQGFLFYELDELKRLAHVRMKGGPFTIHGGKLFVTRDQAIFQYDFRGMAPKAYDRFFKTIQLDSIPLTEGVYFQLLKRARMYPDVIPLNQVAKRFLLEKGITIQHSIAKNSRFMDGRVKRDSVLRPGAGENEDSRSTGEFPRYFIDFELVNRSENAVSLTLMVQWGKSEEDASISRDHLASDVTWHHINVAGYGGKADGRVPVFGGEPKEVYLYPTRVEKQREQ